jgi:hypothetical protein
VLDVCFHLISVKTSKPSHSVPMTDQRWERPPTTALKVNVDGAYSAGQESGAVGVVARSLGLMRESLWWSCHVGRRWRCP